MRKEIAKMKYRSHSETERRGWSRLATTLFALCLPILAATFFSGSFFKLNTLDAGSAHASSGHSSPNAVSISISPGAFVPGDVTVNPGTQVTWTNNTGDRARVRDSQHNLFDSDDLNPGQSFSYTFVTPGVITVVEEREDFTGIV
jgi:plastocyanin